MGRGPIAVWRAVSTDRIVGDGFPVPQPTDYGFAETDAKTKHITAGTGNPSPTMALDNRINAPGDSKRPVERAQWSAVDKRSIERIVSGHCPQTKAPVI